MNSSTSAWGNLGQLYRCLQAGAGSGHCTLVTDADSGFGIALVFALALTVGGIIVSYMGLVLAAGTGRRADRTLLNAVIGVVSAGLWSYLWLAYALPECKGHGYLLWMIISPLFTLVLMVGFIGMVAGIAFTIGNLTSRRIPLATTEGKGAWALITAAVTGILLCWHALYQAKPQIAAGPYGRGPGWFQDALGVWTLHLPVTVLWELAKVLATIPGIAAFAALAALSLILPRRSLGGRAANMASIVTTTAIGEMVGLVVGACVLIVVSLLAVAAVALAFMFFAAYVMAYVLVLSFFGVLVVGAVRR